MAGALMVLGLFGAIVFAVGIRRFGARLPWGRRVGWTLLLPLTIWLLFTPYANVFDLVMALPLLLFIAPTSRDVIERSIVHRLVMVALSVSTVQDLIIVRINMAYDIDALVLLALVAVGVQTLWREVALGPPDESSIQAI